MAKDVLSPGPITRAALDLVPRLWILLILGLTAFAVAWVVTVPLASLGLMLLGTTFIALALIALGLTWRHDARQDNLRVMAQALVADDTAPTVMTDPDGEIRFSNAAAQEAFQMDGARTLAPLLGELCLEPASLLYRLQNRALALGAARETVAIRGGQLQVSVHRVGSEAYLWRLEEIGASRAPGHSGDGIGLPMLTASRSGTILYMNEALRRLLGGRESTLDRVFTDLPLRPGEVHVIHGAQGTRPVLVAEVEMSAGRREIYLLPEPKAPVIDQGNWAIVESLPVPLLKLARSGKVTLANARARKLLGAEDLPGRAMSDLVEGLGRPVDDWLTEAWMGRNLGRTETLRAALRDDETFLQISLERTRDDDGDALIVVMSDATELKSLEGQFVQSQKMQAIGQLAGGVAHDFNNLLTAISGHCDLLLLRHDEADDDFADLTQISQNSNRAAALVGQLLAFSRKQTLRPNVIDLADSMSDLTHLLGRLVGEKVKLDYVHDHEIRPVRADKRQLEQVVMNLVVNARDAMPKGGTVRLEVRNVFLDRPLERDRVRVPRGDYVTIRVVDSGHGIPPEKVSKIFEPFYTTKGAGKGTGLGLSMAYGIVKQSGGFIFVDSVENAGTTFTLYFPVYEIPPDHLLAPMMAAEEALKQAEARATAAIADKREEIEASLEKARGSEMPKPTHDPNLQSGGGTVLLVEDEAPVRAFAARALSLRGYTVVEADSAEAALALLEDPKLKVDVVVTDVVMPGMDGPTWVAKALEDRPGVKVVFVSGYAEESVSEHQKRIPNSVFLPKPFSLSELTATVAAQIH
ncbi:ATP-binding protein [Maritimibacter sp. UBA3975]|uniref:hybrid sensor histidine kinase/response regulator n=1 Tax=Maritimibacter sp. UBA3975 TaxID=1946833 RepID=UPI0025BB1531|nr:ATP-binding protein [Maritimibacter sp. UBA3975]